MKLKKFMQGISIGNKIRVYNIELFRMILLSMIIFFTHLSIKAQDRDFYTKLSDAAIKLTTDKVMYDPTYYKISYPNGDIPANRGVCTDVIVRAYRTTGIDLQKEVHEDMKSNFNKYPSKVMWGLSKTDTNIDHRRVPNLQTFFSRKGIIKPITNNSDDYIAGDIVTWDLGQGLFHIGIVVDKHTSDKKRNLIVHNIGRGQVVEDVLFAWKLTGRYRYKK